MSSGIIFDLRRYAIHDGPGIRTAVFLKGCPLQCAWCHNPEGISYQPEVILRPGLCIHCDDCLPACPNQAVSRLGDSIRIDRRRCRTSGECAAVCPADALALVGREMTVEAVLAEVDRDRVFYGQSGGGVTFTGGEPLAQVEFLQELLSACHDNGLRTAVDTSGFASWSAFERIRPFVDLFLYDIKLMDDDRHREWTGVSNREILANLERLCRADSALLVRIPLLAGINDDEHNLRLTGEFLAALPHPPEVEFLPYHQIAEAKYAGLGREYRLKIPPLEAGKAEQAAALLAEYGVRSLA